MKKFFLISLVSLQVLASFDISGLSNQEMARQVFNMDEFREYESPLHIEDEPRLLEFDPSAKICGEAKGKVCKTVCVTINDPDSSETKEKCTKTCWNGEGEICL